LRGSGRLLVAEEGTQTLGWGAEVIRRVATEGFHLLKAPPRHVAALDLPIANTPTLEQAILPQTDDLIRAALAMVDP
jgi:2-oxoisovalerate dehydrogenase E1 component